MHSLPTAPPVCSLTSPTGGVWRTPCAVFRDRYYNVTPRTHWLETWSGGYAIADRASGHSNIIWSNGKRDPWHGGGFLRPTDALPGGAVFVMEETAHHQDLRAPHPADPPELKRVRAQEEKIIRGWLAAE